MSAKKTILLIESNFEKDNSFFYEKNRFHFLKGIYYYKIQDFEKGKNHCEFFLEVYRQYGEISKYEEMKKEYNTILKDIELSKT